MRACFLVVIALSISAGTVCAQDKLTEKALVGKWTMKLTGIESKLERTMELKTDATFVGNDGKNTREGTYKLNGTTLELRFKGSKDGVNWANLSMKDGKVIRAITKKTTEEWTKAK